MNYSTLSDSLAAKGIKNYEEINMAPPSDAAKQLGVSRYRGVTVKTGSAYLIKEYVNGEFSNAIKI